MKLITVKGEFTVFDGELVLDFGRDGAAAWEYAFRSLRERLGACSTPSLNTQKINNKNQKEKTK